MFNRNGWEGVSVGERSRAATIRRKEKNGRDKYKRQFTEPRLWETTYLNSSRLPRFFTVFLLRPCGSTLSGKWARLGDLERIPKTKEKGRK